MKFVGPQKPAGGGGEGELDPPPGIDDFHNYIAIAIISPGKG